MNSTHSVKIHEVVTSGVIRCASLKNNWPLISALNPLKSILLPTTLQMYHTVARLNQTVSAIQLAPWLEGFIRVHGQEQAMKFLSNVGVVDKKGDNI